MKKFLGLLCFLLFTHVLYADTIEITNFEANVFAKDGTSKKIEADFIFEGKLPQDIEVKILDALNMVIGSYYYQDLLTSKGKIQFKKLLTEYIQKNYSLDIDEIYILKIIEKDEPKLKKMIEEFKKAGCCNGNGNGNSTILSESKTPKENKPKEEKIKEEKSKEIKLPSPLDPPVSPSN